MRFVCIRIAAALDQINKMADCRLYRLEGKQGKFFFCLFTKLSTIKMLIRLCGCTGCSAPLLFA